MTRKMGHRNQNIRLIDFRGHIHLVEAVLVDGYHRLALPSKTIRDDEWRADDRISKTVFDRGRQMPGGFATAAGIQGIRIGQKRPAARGLDRFNDLPDKHRPDKTGIAEFPEMEFHRHQVFRANDPGKSGSGKQLTDFLKQVFLVCGPGVDIIDFWSHGPSYSGHRRPADTSMAGDPSTEVIHNYI